VLADGVGEFATPGFDAAKSGATLTFLAAWCGVLAYTFQLYFDFSGCSGTRECRQPTLQSALIPLPLMPLGPSFTLTLASSARANQLSTSSSVCGWVMLEA